MSHTAKLTTLTDIAVMEMIESRPGTLELRHDWHGNRSWYRDGQTMTKLRARSMESLIKRGLVTVRERKIRTVGLREPRTAWVAYPA